MLSYFLSSLIPLGQNSWPGLTGDRQVAQPLTEAMLKITAMCSELPVHFLFKGEEIKV